LPPLVPPVPVVVVEPPLPPWPPLVPPPLPVVDPPLPPWPPAPVVVPPAVLPLPPTSPSPQPSARNVALDRSKMEVFNAREDRSDMLISTRAERVGKRTAALLSLSDFFVCTA
jgi:hypothetical protein